MQTVTYPPLTFTDVLEERISYCESFLSRANNAKKKNSLENQISSFNASLENFKYCKYLLVQMENNPNDKEVKKKFKNRSLMLLKDLMQTVAAQLGSKQKMNGVSINIKKIDKAMPHKVVDELSDLSQQLKKIESDVKKL